MQKALVQVQKCANFLMYLIYNIIIDFILYLCSFSSSVSVYLFVAFHPTVILLKWLAAYWIMIMIFVQIKSLKLLIFPIKCVTEFLRTEVLGTLICLEFLKIAVYAWKSVYYVIWFYENLMYLKSLKSCIMIMLSNTISNTIASSPFKRAWQPGGGGSGKGRNCM